MTNQDPQQLLCPFCQRPTVATDLDDHIRLHHPTSGYTKPFASHLAGLDLTEPYPLPIRAPIVILHSMSFRGKWSGYLAQLVVSHNINFPERHYLKPSLDERSAEGLGRILFELDELDDGVYAARSANEECQHNPLQTKPQEQRFLVSGGRVIKMLTWREACFYVHRHVQPSCYDEATHECYLAMSTLYHHGPHGCENRAQLVGKHLAVAKLSDPTLHLRLSTQVIITEPLLAIEHLRHIHPDTLAALDHDSPLKLPPLSGSPAQVRWARSLRARVLRQLRLLQYAARSDASESDQLLIHALGPGTVTLFVVYMHKDIGACASRWIDFRDEINGAIGHDNVLAMLQMLIDGVLHNKVFAWRGSYEGALISIDTTVKRLGLEPIKAPEP